jgi:hypothetical protein
MKRVDYPIMDMNRNVIQQNPDYVDEVDIIRMNAFWGDASWRIAAYQPQRNLLGQKIDKKTGNEAIAAAFRDRLRDVAGFKLFQNRCRCETLEVLLCTICFLPPIT